MGNRFLKGAMILTVSMLATRFLGIIYVIPFRGLVSETGMALYQYAYLPYSVFISLSTLGIPVGIAKFISKYNADGEYDTSRKIFKYSLFFMFILGMIGFLTLYLIAPWYASLVLAGEAVTYNTEAEVTTAIRTVSFALLIIPPMSIFRGFFQGNQNMVPTAISQFVEQIVRVSLILIGAYVIIHSFERTARVAVTFAVFAAFLAGLASFLVLAYFWFKNKKRYNRLLKESVPHQERNIKPLFLELVSYAVPFAILGLTMNLFQLIDSVTFNNHMIHGAGVPNVLSEQLFGIYSGLLTKIIMIPVAFAIAFGQPLVPELTHHLRSRNKKEVRRILALAIQLTCFVTLPAVVGLSMLSQPIYRMLFYDANLNQMGGAIFQTGAFIGLFIALYIIITAILQGIGEQKKGIMFLVMALGIKYIGNFILVPRLQVNGAILADVLAYTFCITMSLLVIKKKTDFSFRRLLRRLMPIGVFTAMMALIVVLLRMGLSLVIDYEMSRSMATVYVLIVGLGGVLTYFILTWYFDLLKSLFGFRISLKALSRR